MQDKTSAETQRPSGVSVSYPASGPQPNFDPLLLAEDLQGPDPRERLTQARVSTTPVQPTERLPFSDVNEFNPTAVKIVNLEKQFKRAQGLNSIHDIEDWSTEVAVKLPVESTNAGGSTISKPAEVNTVAIADPFAKASLQIASSARAQGRFFTPLHMSLTRAFKVLMERGHLKPLNPQPSPNPLPARHNPSKYCVYHQQRGHGTDGCYRLRHEIQNLIDNRTIVPPQNPKDQVPPPHLNLSQTLPPTYNPSIYTPTHILKPDMFIPESMGLSTMDALEPQSSQTREPMTSELKRMIEDLQRTVIGLASGTSAPSSTTSHAREFMSKGSPISERAIFEECQSLGKVEASGKN